MSVFKPAVPPEAVPVLTEVVDLTSERPPVLAPAVPDRLDPAVSLTTRPVPPSATASANGPTALSPAGHAPVELPSQDELTLDVMASIQRQVDAMLEYRMREALAPALTRLTDALVRDARSELAVVLKDIVGRAVTQEIAKRRPK